MHWYVDVLRKYGLISGRARRQEYWMYNLFNLIALIGLLIISAVVGTTIPYLVYVALVIVPSIAVTARRLHDTGKSGWFILLGIIPLAGGIVLLIFTCIEGDPQPNAYGPNPKYAPAHL